MDLVLEIYLLFAVCIVAVLVSIFVDYVMHLCPLR